MALQYLSTNKTEATSIRKTCGMFGRCNWKVVAVDIWWGQSLTSRNIFYSSNRRSTLESAIDVHLQNGRHAMTKNGGNHKVAAVNEFTV